MNKIAVFFAEGYEEIEALTVVDICRRCGIEVDMVSVTEERMVKGAHGIAVETDKTCSQAEFDAYAMLVLPGGGEGTRRLGECGPLMEKVDAFDRAGKYIAAICAAPSILGDRGILRGRRACSYPAFESRLDGAEITAGPVEIDQNIITSRGMGTSIPFALAIAGIFCGQEKAEEMAKAIIYSV